MNFEMLKNIMIAQTNKTGVTANNLANMNSTGFKRDVAFVDYLNENTDSDLTVKTDFSSGQLKQTANPLDLAITGRGFFSVDTKWGEAYTRDGHFQIGQDGTLRTSDGNPVLGEGGLINVSMDGMKTGDFNISTKGEIFMNNELMDVLRIVDFSSYDNLKKTGGSFFQSTNGMTPMRVEEPSVKQGSLEVSNVSPVEEMIDLIELQRQFESSQRTVKIIDSILGKAVNDIGKY